MKATRIPTFNAEASLYKSITYYSIGASQIKQTYNLTQPAMMILIDGNDWGGWPFSSGGGGGGGGYSCCADARTSVTPKCVVWGTCPSNGRSYCCAAVEN